MLVQIGRPSTSSPHVAQPAAPERRFAGTLASRRCGVQAGSKVVLVLPGFFPRVLGILLLVAGFGNLTSGVTSIVLPAYSHVVSQATMPLLFGEFPIIFWLLIKGARVPPSFPA